MKKLLTLLMCAAFIANLSAQKMDGDKFNNLTKGFETPHHKWAEKLSGGKLRTLFVLSLANARDAVEAAQRMDLTLDAVTTALRNRSMTLGITADSDTYYGSLYSGSSDTDKAAELSKKLDGGYDVVFIQKVDFDKLSAELKLKLFLKVKNGMGLVVTNCKNIPKGLFKNRLDKVGKEIVELASETPVKCIESYQFGKGRVIKITPPYKLDIGNRSVEVGGSMLPVPFHFSSLKWWSAYENAQVCFLRTLLWAARGTPDVEISSPLLKPGVVLEQQATAIPVVVKAAKPGTLHVRLRNEYNTIIDTKTLPYQTQSNLSYELPFLSGGRYFLDLMAKDDSGTENFGYLAFIIKSPVTASIQCEKDSIKDFSPIEALVTLDKPLRKSKAVVSLIDSPYGRVWYREEIDISGEERVKIIVKDYYMPTLAAFLRVDVKENGKTISSAEKTFFFPYYQTRLPLYMDTQWEYNPGGTDILRSMAEAGEMGNTGIWLRIDGNRPKVQTQMLLNQRQMTHCAGIWLPKQPLKDRSLKHDLGWVKKYYKESELNDEDKKALEKQEYTLGDPLSDRRNKLAVGAVFRNKKLWDYPLATYGLGNETSCQFANGFSKIDDQAYREMLKKEYGTIENLNKEWGRDYKSFADVSHLTLTDARGKKMFPEYLAHMRYINRTVESSVKATSDEIKKRAPHAKIGCDGVWSSNNDGFNMERILANNNINSWGPYTRLPQLEILRSMRPDLHHLTVWGWLMSNEALPEAPWFNLLIGTCNEISWFISGASMGGVKLAADYRAFRPNMEDELQKLRSGVAQLLISTPLEHDGIAIWENYESTKASKLGDPRFVQTTASSMALIDFFYQYGLNFDYVVRNTLDKLNNYKVLFLCGASSIGELERKAIIEFARNGGTVVADINPGMMNDSYKILDKNQLSELFGEFNPKNVPAPKPQEMKLDAKLNGRALNLTAKDVMATPGMPFLSARDCGKGKGVLLNFTIGSAEVGAKDDVFDSFLLEFLSAVGIKPELKVSGLPPKSTVRVREGKDFELIGLTNRRLAMKGANGGKVKVTLPKAGYIYKVDEGYLAQSDSIDFEFAPPFKLFTIFKDEQKAPVLNLSSGDVVPGKPLVVDLSSLPVKRTMRIRVFDPNGKNVLKNNEIVTHEVFETGGDLKEKKLYFAYNWPKGNYKVVLTDIATGLSSTRSVELK